MRRAIGFTLIELVTALTLLGILVKLGLPAFTAWIRNAQVRTVGEALQNGLRTAQSEALRLNRPVVIAFTNSSTTPSTSAPWPVVANGPNWWIQTIPKLSDTTGRFVAAGTFTDVASGVAINSLESNGAPANANAVCFNSNGRVATPTTAIGVPGAVCDSSLLPLTFNITQAGADRNLYVILSVGGQVHMCDPKRTLSAAAPDGCPPPS